MNFNTIIGRSAMSRKRQGHVARVYHVTYSLITLFLRLLFLLYHLGFRLQPRVLSKEFLLEFRPQYLGDA